MGDDVDIKDSETFLAMCIQSVFFVFLLYDVRTESWNNNGMVGVVGNFLVLFGCSRALYRSRWLVKWSLKTEEPGNSPGSEDTGLQYRKIRLMWSCVSLFPLPAVVPNSL